MDGVMGGGSATVHSATVHSATEGPDGACVGRTLRVTMKPCAYERPPRFRVS